jgi:hypothetical protein
MAVSRYQNTSQSVPSTPSEPTNNYFDPVILIFYLKNFNF